MTALQARRGRWPGLQQVATELDWPQERVQSFLAEAADILAANEHHRLPSADGPLTMKGNKGEPRIPVALGISDAPAALAKQDARKRLRAEIDAGVTGASGPVWWHADAGPVSRGDHWAPTDTEAERWEREQDEDEADRESVLSDESDTRDWDRLADCWSSILDEPPAEWESLLCRNCHDRPANDVDGLCEDCRQNKNGGRHTAEKTGRRRKTG